MDGFTRIKPTARQAGQSLFELIVVIALAVAINLFALPSMQRLYKTNTIRQTRMALLQDIRVVRHAAISHRRPAYLCSPDATDRCSQRPNWDQGWLGFIDRNLDGGFDAGDKLLLRHPGTEQRPGISIFLHARWKTIKFDSRGVLRRSGHIRICDPKETDEQPMKVIRMNLYGRVAVETESLPCN